MNVPAPPVFRPDDFPDTDAHLLDVLNRLTSDVYNALSAVPQVVEDGDKVFTTPASGAATVDLKNQLPGQPKHLTVTRLQRDDGADLAAVYSSEWRLVSGGIRLSFVGLPASTKMRFSVEYR